MHSAHIHGIHVDEYWGHLEENDSEKAKAHFTKWQECLNANKVESIPDLFDKVVEGIKKDSGRVGKKTCPKPVRKGDIIESNGKKWTRNLKLTKEKKREIIKQRITEAAQKLRDQQDN